jgi:hypothetical protein
MLRFAGGRQRTPQEFASPLGGAGFALEGEVDTTAEIAILEATNKV